jgi:uncharacterized phage protein (TIGR02220 family)
MFSKTITNSSEFLMMPDSAQNLYFHLGMNADDDGYCEHFTIMRMTDSKPDNLKILAAKKFVYVFDDKVLIITDWKENNLIRSDRYNPSKYKEIYSGIPNGNQRYDEREPQVRLGKVRLGKDITTIVEEIPYKEIVEYLNEVTGKNYKHNANKTKGFITARWNDGYRLEDFKKVIDIKDKDWKDDKKWEKFRRPSTLFGTKFDEYLNQQGEPARKQRSPEVQKIIDGMFGGTDYET